jgi:hypothetical protein
LKALRAGGWGVCTSVGNIPQSLSSASMEGACATGAFTAQAVLHDMGLPTEHIMTALGVRLSSSHMAFNTPSQHGGAVRRRFPQQFPQAS